MNYRQPFTGSYPITQVYGGTDTSAFHTGIDYACPLQTPILASEDGTVLSAGWLAGGWGHCVILQHRDGNATLYAHLTAVAVSIAQSVNRSQIIGYSGSTGNSTGPHLHFEARRSALDARTHFDPMDLPLHSSIEPTKPTLKGADQLGKDVIITAPAGAWGWAKDFGVRATVFPQGTRLTYTGRTAQRLGYTYCEVYPEPVTYWVAVNDGETQILDNQV